MTSWTAARLRAPCWEARETTRSPRATASATPWTVERAAGTRRAWTEQTGSGGARSSGGRGGNRYRRTTLNHTPLIRGLGPSTMLSNRSCGLAHMQRPTPASLLSVLPFPPGEPGRDFLEQPVVPVRVVERRVHEVRAPFYRFEARGPLLVDLADVDAAADEIVPGGVDVLNGENQPVKGTRLSPQRDALAEVDRAVRVGRRHLYRTELVAGSQVGVQSPTEALIEALGPFDVGDGQ